jgi:DNA-binding NarL/FixJ family response regulator
MQPGLDQDRSARIRIVVVDDHPLFRAGISHTLSADADLDVVGEGCSAEDALRLARDERPDVMVLDLSMPGGGLRAIELLADPFPNLRLLVLSGVADVEQVRAAMQKGAWGYLLKGVSGAELTQTLHAIHRGERYVTPALAAQLFAAPAPPAPAIVTEDIFAGLTSREEQVLALVADGLSNKEIGGRLALSEKTVKHYITIVLDKLNVPTRVQAALLAHAQRHRRELGG